MNTIPNDLCEVIFSCLEGVDLAQVLGVSKSFELCAKSLYEERRFTRFYQLVAELLQYYKELQPCPNGGGITVHVDDQAWFITHDRRQWISRDMTFECIDDLLNSIARYGAKYHVSVSDSNLMMEYPWLIYQLSGPHQKETISHILDLKQQQAWSNLIQWCDEFLEASIYAQELSDMMKPLYSYPGRNDRIVRELQGQVRIMNEREHNIHGLFHDIAWKYTPHFGTAVPDAYEYMTDIVHKQDTIKNIHNVVVADWHARGPKNLDDTIIDMQLTRYIHASLAY